ncbi:MAG: hypothetical protein HY540_01245, partial [Deltaproteobacteria bacterium]|nr:hypothetical protein [Deltaproteobacteria bacterium]
MNDGWRKELLTLMTATKGEKELNELLEALLTPVEREELAVRWQ